MLPYRYIAGLALVIPAHAAVLYTQGFDTFDDVPSSSVFYDAASVYDGLSGAATGANLTGNANLNGQLITVNGPTVAQSGTYFLFSNTLGTTPQAEVWGTNSSQTIVVTQGQIYEISFYLAGLNTIAPARLSPRINGVALEGVVVDSVQNPAAAATYSTANSWVKHTYRWQADSAAADLSLVNLTTTASGNDFFLDTITFSSVPEPASGALLCLGAFGLLGRRRR